MNNISHSTSGAKHYIQNGEYIVKKSFKILICLMGMFLTFSIIWADEEEISKIFELTTGLGANNLGELAWDGSTLWVEGSGSLTNLVGEGHNVNDWITYKEMDGFGQGSISALCVYQDIFIAAWGYGQIYQDELIPAGDGISISFDHGSTWMHITVLDLFPERADYKYPGNYTTIYDIVLSDGVIWCSTTTGFLLKSDDLGVSWTQVLPEDLAEIKDEYDRFRETNFHGQCVDVYGDTIWVGTFKGINLSVDSGKTWENFSWPEDGSGDTDIDQYPGNFPVAVEHKVTGGKTHVWVASHDYLGLGVYGICYTSDNGTTWEYKKYLDINSRPYNFAFGHSGATDPAVSDSTVFVATRAGLLVSYDLGENWDTMNIRESDNLYWEEKSEVSYVLVVGDTLWVTSADGLARTIASIDTTWVDSSAVVDTTAWGDSWEIFKGVYRVKTLDTGNRNIGIASGYDYLNDNVETYAFPNPFSPRRPNSDYSRTRIQYSLENDAEITVEIYNYSGKLLREIVSGEHRNGGRDYQEVWDGKDDNNSIVPNGVYFYIIKTDKGDSAHGKIMVLD